MTSLPLFAALVAAIGAFGAGALHTRVFWGPSTDEEFEEEPSGDRDEAMVAAACAFLGPLVAWMFIALGGAVSR